MTVGITGAHGFLGWHMRCFLHACKVKNVRLAGRETFASREALKNFARGCDIIFHFAGVNRSKNEEEIATANPLLAKKLVEALDSAGGKPFVVYSSSTHVDGDSTYGSSKRQAGEIIKSWAARTGAQAAIIVYPHLYGEGGRPFYNSVAHTFCHQLANNETLTVDSDAELQLLHAQDAVEYAWKLFKQGRSGELRPNGRPISVRQLADILTSFYAIYSGGVIPDIRDDEDRRLFNTLRSFMFPAAYPMVLKRNEDPRGWLFEAVRELNGGQVFLSSTHPGYTRGNHYHRFKVERFCVLAGEATIRIRKLFSDEVHEFKVTGDKPVFIDMPPLHTHSIANESDADVTTLFWANEFFDPKHPDTYPEPVIQ